MALLKVLQRNNPPPRRKNWYGQTWIIIQIGLVQYFWGLTFKFDYPRIRQSRTWASADLMGGTWWRIKSIPCCDEWGSVSRRLWHWDNWNDREYQGSRYQQAIKGNKVRPCSGLKWEHIDMRLGIRQLGWCMVVWKCQASWWSWQGFGMCLCIRIYLGYLCQDTGYILLDIRRGMGSHWGWNYSI